MKTIPKQLLLMAAALVLSVSSLTARTDEQEAARHELRSQLSQFAKSTVFPSLNVWKSQLDRAMQPEDLKALNALRDHATELRKQGKQALKSMHESWKNEDYTMLKSSRDQLKSLMQERDKLFGELKPIAMKYKETLKTIGETAKPKVIEWKEKGREIVKSWAESHPDIAAKGRGFKGGFLSHLGGGDKKVAVARFMLWNGDETIIDEMDQEQFHPTPPQKENGGALEPSNSPNPFGTNTSINFSLPKNDKVSLKVYDLNGTIVETLADGELPAGEHSFNFSPNTPSGTYFYRLETSEGAKQKSMEFVR